MLEFMKMGGIAMWLILLFGSISLITACLYAWRPNRKQYDFLRAMMKATLFASVSGLCLGFSTTLLSIVNNQTWAHSKDIHLVVMQGLGESLCNPSLGFTMLAVCWLVTAFGERRSTIA